MKNYSFLNTVLLVNGVPISGFDEGDDVIALERNNDSASHKVGSDGTMTVSQTADHSGSITFRLMQSSDSNSYLSGLAAAAEQGVIVPVIVQFQDLTSGDLGSGTEGYITRPATMTRGANANAQEWSVTVEKLQLIYGGVVASVLDL